MGARTEGQSLGLGDFTSGSNSSSGRKQEGTVNGSRLLDLKKHMVAVIKENKDPNMTSDGDVNLINNLGFTNLISPDSLPTFFKDKMAKKNGENGEYMREGSLGGLVRSVP